jgi:hypothetical protein
MNAFDKEYFFLTFPDDESVPAATPDDDTEAKPFIYEALPFGQKPLVFYNGALDFQTEKRIRPMDPPPDVLFYGGHMIVRRRIADKLWELEIPNLVIQPAIYIDHKNNWHEDYWFLTFTASFDCWDREHSKYDPDDGFLGAHIYTYSLNVKLLQETPLRARRLFRMGETVPGMVTVHKSLVDLFRIKGVKVIPLKDFGRRDTDE